MQATSTFPFHFHFHFHIFIHHIINISYVDANGLKKYILLHSKYNLVTDDINSTECYYLGENQSISDIPSDTPNLIICGYGNLLQTIDFPNTLHNLKSITIGNACFKNVREFVVDGLESLESVKIGVECFRIGDGERNDGICRITNCPNLRQLEIGDGSFIDFKSFEISNLNSIQSIKFGNGCLQYADYSLKGE